MEGGSRWSLWNRGFWFWASFETGCVTLACPFLLASVSPSVAPSTLVSLCSPFSASMVPLMGPWGGGWGPGPGQPPFLLPLPTCIHLHAQGEAGGLVGKATGFGDGHLCLYPSSGLSLEWPGPGTNPWCEDTGVPWGGKTIRPCGPPMGRFTLWELILCPTEPSPWIRAVSGRDGAPDPRREGHVGMEGAWLGPGHPGVGFGSWAGCEPLRHSLGRAVRDGTAGDRPPPPYTQGFLGALREPAS